MSGRNHRDIVQFSNPDQSYQVVALRLKAAINKCLSRQFSRVVLRSKGRRRADIQFSVCGTNNLRGPK